MVIGWGTSGTMQLRGTGLARDDLAGLSCALSAGEKSRQIVLQEVLTGTMDGYSLNAVTPSTSVPGTLGECKPGDYRAVFTSQANDGVLDS